jgi:hypothetical protein
LIVLIHLKHGSEKERFPPPHRASSLPGNPAAGRVPSSCSACSCEKKNSHFV